VEKKVGGDIELEADTLTAKFNDPEIELIELKEYLIDNEGRRM
jgi:hypothetical protein